MNPQINKDNVKMEYEWEAKRILELLEQGFSIRVRFGDSKANWSMPASDYKARFKGFSKEESITYIEQLLSGSARFCGEPTIFCPLDHKQKHDLVGDIEGEFSLECVKKQ